MSACAKCRTSDFRAGQLDFTHFIFYRTSMMIDGQIPEVPENIGYEI
jgi:hypothetical protein